MDVYGHMRVFDPIFGHLTIIKNEGAEQYFVSSGRLKKDIELR